MLAHFKNSLSQVDPLIADALSNEKRRQQDQIELIASENIVSRAVLDALGHEITNKTLEGYPGNRFHGGGQFVDVAEQAAIDRARQLFGCSYANVQPHSGSQANLAVFFLFQGGGASGQAGAVRMGLARALLTTDADLRPTLKSEGLLTRDSRMKERKKYGQPGARKRFQFSKR